MFYTIKIHTVSLIYLESGLHLKNALLSLSGIKNICPEVVSGMHEPFSCLMKKAAVWLSDERQVQVVNIRSCLVYRDNSRCYFNITL